MTYRLSWELYFALLVVLQSVPFVSVVTSETLEGNCYSLIGDFLFLNPVLRR